MCPCPIRRPNPETLPGARRDPDVHARPDRQNCCAGRAHRSRHHYPASPARSVLRRQRPVLLPSYPADPGEENGEKGVEHDHQENRLHNGGGGSQDRKSTRLTPVTNAHLVCRLLLEKKKTNTKKMTAND